MNQLRLIISAFFSFILFSTSLHYTYAQSEDEHAKHHPQEKTSDNTDSSSTTIKGEKKESDVGMGGDKSEGMGGGKSGGMGGGMGEMMKGMGKPTTKEIYPALMQLPDLSQEKRNEIKQLADARVTEGNQLLTMGLRSLPGATREHDLKAIEEATEQIRRGQVILEIGLEGQRALAENKDPRITALQWFKREMKLTSPEISQPHGFFGLSWFHYITMLLFLLFAIFMIWMYFHKMKRANSLILKLSVSGEKIPPPGGSNPDTSKQPAGKTEPVAKTGTSVKSETVSKTAVNSDIEPSKPNSWNGTLLVAEIFNETPAVKTYRLIDPMGGKLPFNFLPGQFITVTCVPKGVPIKRSYTISSSPTHRDSCEITVKHEDEGSVSHYLHTQIHEGELLQLTAPSGKFTFTEKEADSVVFIGGGVGVTPMMSAIRYLTDRSWKKDIYYIILCKNEESIIFKEEIEYLQKRYLNFHVKIVLSQPVGQVNEAYVSGHVTKEVISAFIPEIITRQIHICGPPRMMDAVKQMLNELNVPKENVKEEVFASPPAAKQVNTEKAGEGNQLTEDANKPETPEAGTGVVTFSKSGKTAILTPDKSILEASEEVGVNIDYSCRVGTCGICKTKLISGKVTMAVQDALTEDDIAQNIILACQAKATEEVSVDA